MAINKEYRREQLLYFLFMYAGLLGIALPILLRRSMPFEYVGESLQLLSVALLTAGVSQYFSARSVARLDQVVRNSVNMAADGVRELRLLDFGRFFSMLTEHAEASKRLDFVLKVSDGSKGERRLLQCLASLPKVEHWRILITEGNDPAASKRLMERALEFRSDISIRLCRGKSSETFIRHERGVLIVVPLIDEPKEEISSILDVAPESELARRLRERFEQLWSMAVELDMVDRA